MKFYASTFLLLLTTNAFALYNPKMRNNFGANHAVLRINSGYYGYVYQRRIPLSYENGGSVTANYNMTSNLRLGLEAMVMVNNRGRFSESVSKSRPVFLQTKVQYDGLEKNTLITAGYAHGLTCKATFLFFGQVRGYFSAGAAMLINNDPNAVDHKNEVGARIGYNVYNAGSALQFDTYIFEDKVLVTTVAHKKIGRSFLINVGVTRNQPCIGFSAMIGSCRLSATTQYNKENIQSGVNLTMNF